MSNFIVGGWSALKAELHFATELFGRSAGPDGAIDRIKHGLGEVLAKFERLAVEEAAKSVPVVEQTAVAAVDLGLQASAPVLETHLGEAGGAVAEVALQVAAGVGEQVADKALEGAVATAEAHVEPAPVEPSTADGQ